MKWKQLVLTRKINFQYVASFVVIGSDIMFEYYSRIFRYSNYIFEFLESMKSFLNRRYISKKKSQSVSESSGNALQKI